MGVDAGNQVLDLVESARHIFGEGIFAQYEHRLRSSIMRIDQMHLHVHDALRDREERVQEYKSGFMPQVDELAPVHLPHLTPGHDPRAMHRPLHIPARRSPELQSRRQHAWPD